MTSEYIRSSLHEVLPVRLDGGGERTETGIPRPRDDVSPSNGIMTECESYEREGSKDGLLPVRLLEP